MHKYQHLIPKGLIAPVIILFSSILINAQTIDVSPSAVAFGNQTTDATSAQQNVILKNVGASNLSIGSYALGGSNAADFAVLNFPNGTVLTPNQQINFAVTFTPSAIGARSASIQFPTNDPGRPVVTINVAGTGIAPTPTPTPTATPTPDPPGTWETNEFTYQGKLTESGTPVTGLRAFRFRLWDDTLDAQIGSDIVLPNVGVAGGIFTVSLDFGTAPFDGGFRSLQISVGPADAGSFTILTPRQAISATPYAIRSLNATNAGYAANAADAEQLGGVAAANYVVTTDARLTDARDPLPGNAGYIQNQSAAPQASSNFSIDGIGRAGIFSAATAFNFGNTPALTFGTSGSWNLHVGGDSPSSTGSFLTTSGRFAGFSNTTGSYNSFLGFNTGRNNTEGSSNSFFGATAGTANTTGNWNTFMGYAAGSQNTTGIGNNFFGSQTGQSNTTGCCNSFFGGSAGISNTTGQFNVFFGEHAGGTNTTGGNNTVVGANADVGTGDLNYATAIGAGASVGTSNTVVIGRDADTVRAPGNLKVGPGAGLPVAAGEENLKIIRGVVNADGSIAYGSGFTVSKFGTGGYTINFTNQFSDIPAVTANSFSNFARIITIGPLSSGSVNILVFASGGSAADGSFHFTAIGPR